MGESPVISSADLIALADEIDSRLGPISGQRADHIARVLRSTAAQVDRLRAALDAHHRRAEAELSDEPETQNCEHCDKPTPMEDLIGHADVSLCPACDAAWREGFNACDHEWQAWHDEHGEPAQVCHRCSGCVRDEDFPDLFGRPAPVRPDESEGI